MKLLLTVPHWKFWQWGLLMAGSVACGFINALAGGGSLLTVPLLIFFGLPAQIANATNRMALVVQTGAATYGFMAGGIRDAKTVLYLAIPGLLGSAVGAYLAVFLDPDLFRYLFGGFLILSALPAILKPAAFHAPPLRERKEEFSPPGLTLLAIFFFIGLYSGFIQIGIGVWTLLALLFIGGYDVHHSNTIKSQLLFLTTGIATGIFLYHDQVILAVGAVLSVGNAIGSWGATLLARKKEMRWINWLLLGSAVAAALRLFRLI